MRLRKEEERGLLKEIEAQAQHIQDILHNSYQVITQLSADLASINGKALELSVKIDRVARLRE